MKTICDILPAYSDLIKSLPRIRKGYVKNDNNGIRDIDIYIKNHIHHDMPSYIMINVIKYENFYLMKNKKNHYIGIIIPSGKKDDLILRIGNFMIDTQIRERQFKACGLYVKINENDIVIYGNNTYIRIINPSYYQQIPLINELIIF